MTAREREIVGLLAEGMSGAQIARELFLSPETVRTHVRNAMARLGASTRSQAVALALERDEIPSAPATPRPPQPAAPAARGAERMAESAAAFADMLAGLAKLYDLDGGAVFGIEDDGMTLRRVAAERAESANGVDLPDGFSLGEGPLGKVALERRTQVVGPAGSDAPHGGVLAAPIIASGKLVGLLALVIRTSRPTGRSETLLMQAFANRIGEILVSAGDLSPALERTSDRFRASWAAVTRRT